MELQDERINPPEVEATVKKLIQHFEEDKRHDRYVTIAILVYVAIFILGLIYLAFQKPLIFWHSFLLWLGLSMLGFRLISYLFCSIVYLRSKFELFELIEVLFWSGVIIVYNIILYKESGIRLLIAADIIMLQRIPNLTNPERSKRSTFRMIQNLIWFATVPLIYFCP